MPGEKARVQDRIVCDARLLWLGSVIKTGRIPKAEASRGHAILVNDDSVGIKEDLTWAHVATMSQRMAHEVQIRRAADKVA